MSKSVAIAFFVLFCSTLAAAQNKLKSNLSGTWILDSAKSETSNNFLEDSVRSITIEQSEPEIKIIRKSESVSIQTVFYTDGRGETYKSPGSSMSMQSKTKWDGDKLVIHFVGGGIAFTGARNLNVVEEWKLSKDGQDADQENHRHSATQRSRSH